MDRQKKKIKMVEQKVVILQGVCFVDQQSELLICSSLSEI